MTEVGGAPSSRCSETFRRRIANALAANPRQAQRANAVNATCADAASASLVSIAGQRQLAAVCTARHCLLACDRRRTRHYARSRDSTHERRSVTGRIMVVVIGKEGRVENGLRRDQQASSAADAQRE